MFVFACMFFNLHSSELGRCFFHFTGEYIEIISGNGTFLGSGKFGIQPEESRGHYTISEHIITNTQ